MTQKPRLNTKRHISSSLHVLNRLFLCSCPPCHYFSLASKSGKVSPSNKHLAFSKNVFQFGNAPISQSWLDFFRGSSEQWMERISFPEFQIVAKRGFGISIPCCHYCDGHFCWVESSPQGIFEGFLRYLFVRFFWPSWGRSFCHIYLPFLPTIHVALWQL